MAKLDRHEQRKVKRERNRLRRERGEASGRGSRSQGPVDPLLLVILGKGRAAALAAHMDRRWRREARQKHDDG